MGRAPKFGDIAKSSIVPEKRGECYRFDRRNEIKKRIDPPPPVTVVEIFSNFTNSYVRKCRNYLRNIFVYANSRNTYTRPLPQVLRTSVRCRRIVSTRTDGRLARNFVNNTRRPSVILPSRRYWRYILPVPSRLE